MKNTVAVFIMFVVMAVIVGLWFSPLAGTGRVREYKNNEISGEIVGLCYTADEVRSDFYGDETDMYKALDGMLARIVKTVITPDGVIVYALSPRVSVRPQKTSEGDMYNIMAACTERGVCIGAPVLSGSY